MISQDFGIRSRASVSPRSISPKSSSCPYDRFTSDDIDSKNRVPPQRGCTKFLRYIFVFLLGSLFGWTVLRSSTSSTVSLTVSLTAQTVPSSEKGVRYKGGNVNLKPGDYKDFTNKAATSMNCIMISPRLGRPWVDPGRYCFAEEPYVHDSSSDHIWSGFIGIGPSRTGSTALFESLGKHPNIQLGDPGRNDQQCCAGSELYFFERDDMLMKGLDYYKNFFGPRRSGVIIAGEKTPRYSDNPLVPYRIRSALGPDVKLIFTIRNPMEAAISLWKMRMARRDESLQMGFVEYMKQLLHQQISYDKCISTKVHTALEKFSSFSNFSINFFDTFRLFGFTWKQAEQLDEAAYPCWARLDKIPLEEMHEVEEEKKLIDSQGISDIMDERMQHYFMRDNLVRWKLVFGKKQILCVWYDELRVYGRDVLNKVAEFLGVDTFPADFKMDFGTSSVSEIIKELKKENRSEYNRYCRILKTRNQRINEICPRMFDDVFKWC